MGYDCTLHVIDPTAIREIYCRKLLGLEAEGNDFGDEIKSKEIWEKLRAAIESDDPKIAAATIAEGAILFSAAALPAHYERGFCLSLWSSEMEDDSMLAEVPKKHRGLAPDLDELFAPLIAAHPTLKGHWPTAIEDNGSVGINVPKEKISGLLKWAKNKIKTYAKPNRRVFRGLLLVLEECQRRGLAYWEATDIARVIHPVQMPKDLQPAWLSDLTFPVKGYWDVIALANEPGEAPRAVFVDHGSRQNLTFLADLATWPPTWNRVDEKLKPCDRSRDGQWLVVTQRETDISFRSAPRNLELRTSLEVPASKIDIPRSKAAWDSVRQMFGFKATPESCSLDVHFVGIVGELPVLTLCVKIVPPAMRIAGQDADVLDPYRPLVLRGGRLIEAEELPASTREYEHVEVVRLPDGADVLIWKDAGYELSNGTLKPTFSLVPKGWRPWSLDGSCAIGQDAILIKGGKAAPNGNASRLALFLARRGVAPIEIAPAASNIDYFSSGPDGSVLARQIGLNPKHLGCILWPEAGPGGTVIWLDDDLFPDEDPGRIRGFLWSAPARKLIATTPHRLWAVDADHVLALPQYDATMGKRLKK